MLEAMTPRPGLRVLVTAGASGIGLVMAQAFAEAKAKVHVCDIAPEAIDSIRTTLPGVTATQADVADEAAVDRVFDDVRRHLGGLDVLVNNAGIAGPTARIEEIDPAEWRRTIDVNLNAQFYFLRRAVPMLRAAGNGAIINMASVAGRLGYAFRSPYAASKWAIVGLTESLAIELGPEGIRVNAILPGVVAGERIRKVIGARAQTLGIPYEEMEQEYLKKVSLRRMVTPQDIAGMALFLCSPAGANISGQALSVCGNVETL